MIPGNDFKMFLAENVIVNYSNIELARADQIKREGKSSMIFNSSFKGNKQGELVKRGRAPKAN